MRITLHFIFAATCFVLLIPWVASARNVDLSTVPKRDTVQLTIYNSEDLTLVRETRLITFKKGVNPLQFSWANTLIDPTSVQLRFLSDAAKLEVLDTTFPHDKPDMLYWNVQSTFDGEAKVEITYFTSGITWSADYIGVATKDEKAMRLEGFVRVTNSSGEDYEDASVRLVVGKINLVEKIATLAHVETEEAKKLAEVPEGKGLRRDAVKLELDGMDFNAPSTQPMHASIKKIAKESLSDYFIFSIEGTETIPTGWSKRMRSIETAAAPVKIQYRYRPAEYGDNLVRMYLMANDKDSKLGTAPLPDGVFRIFRDNGRGGLSFLAAQNVKYIPIGDKIELNLGVDPNVQFELVKLRVSRENIWMQINGAEIFRKVGAPGIRIEPASTVAGWDDRELYSQRVINHTASAIEVEIRRSFPGDILFRSGLKPTLFDYQTSQFTATIDAGRKQDLLFEIVRREGHNAKQNNVVLQADEKVGQ
jgi:hypothetical protein